MDYFLETYSPPKLNQEELNNLKRINTRRNRICNLKKNQKLPTNKSPGPDSFTGEFYHSYNEELTTILLKFFQKAEEEGILSKKSYEATITPKPKPDKDSTKKIKLRDQ